MESKYRPEFFKEYLHDQVENLSRCMNISKEEAEEFVKNKVKEKYKAPKIIANIMVRPGYEEKHQITFKEFLTAAKSHIVCPNGRIYVNPDQTPATVRQYIKDLLKRRSYHKKKMFAHQQRKEKEAQAMEKANESRIKIDANTLTGGAKNSPYSCFYDKAGFNAVTAVARLMIKTNYSVIEQVFGGNYYWKDKDELWHNIILRLRHCPSEETINKLISKYNLYVPTIDDLMERYEHFMTLYEIGPSYLQKDLFENFGSNTDSSYTNQLLFNSSVKNMMTMHPILNNEKIVDLSPIEQLLRTCSTHELTYLYYVNNLRILFFKNKETFLPIIYNMVNCVGFDESINHDVANMFKLDGDLLPIVSTRFADLVKGKEIGEVIEEEKEIGQKLVNYLYFLFDNFNSLEDVFSTFFRTPVGTTRISIKEDMWRNTTLGSDTDSIIYTLKEWVHWYSGDYFTDTIEIDSMLAIIAFYVAKVASHNTRLLSVHLGCKGDDLKLLNFKGEYDFNSMIFYLIKKHYTGVMTIQEGRVLPEVKLDIKGIGLRNSAIPKVVIDKLKDFSIESQGRQTASHYLKELIGMEKEMATDLRRGSTQFLKSISVKNKDEYKDADASNHFYLEFWNFVFGEKYGQIFTPVKCPCIFLRPFDQEVINDIKIIDPEIVNRIKYYLKLFPKRNFGSIVMNPIAKQIPEELIVWIDMRKHIYTNLKPLYLTMESFGLPLSHNHKHQLLVSDYYDEFDLKLLESEEGEENA